MAQAEPLKRIRDQHGLQSRLTEKGKLGSGQDSGGGRRGGVCGRFITLKAGASRRGMGRPAAAIARLGFDGAAGVHCAQAAIQRKNRLHEKQRDECETPEHGQLIIVLCSSYRQRMTRLNYCMYSSFNTKDFRAGLFPRSALTSRRYRHYRHLLVPPESPERGENHNFLSSESDGSVIKATPTAPPAAFSRRSFP